MSVTPYLAKLSNYIEILAKLTYTKLYVVSRSHQYILIKTTIIDAFLDPRML